jgi:uncharacterized protein YegL
MTFKGKKHATATPLTSQLPSSATPHTTADRGDIAGADNNAPRVLLAKGLDVSDSVKPFADEIAAGEAEMARTLGEHRVARLSVEVASARIGTPPRLEPFRPAGERPATPLAFTGGSPYGTTLDLLSDELVRRADELAAAGIDVQKAFAVVIGDGRVNSESAAVTAKAVERFRSLQDPSSLGLVVFPVAVGEADLAFLGRLSAGNAPKRLRDFDFRSLFRWLASVAVTVSVSQPGAAACSAGWRAWR